MSRRHAIEKEYDWTLPSQTQDSNLTEVIADEATEIVEPRLIDETPYKLRDSHLPGSTLAEASQRDEVRQASIPYLDSLDDALQQIVSELELLG